MSEDIRLHKFFQFSQKLKIKSNFFRKNLGMMSFRYKKNWVSRTKDDDFSLGRVQSRFRTLTFIGFFGLL